MRMRTIIGWGAALGIAAGFAACSLNLDKSKIAGRDGGTDTASGGSAAGGSSGSGGSSGNAGSGGSQMEAGSECDAASQCKSDAACIQGSCNNGNCVYDLCPVTQACTASSCDQKTQACTTPAPIGFSAGVIPVNQDLGCGTNSSSATRCIAAMGDFVFVGTASGLKAWQVINPKAPVSVPVIQPPFATSIARLVSNDKRVMVLGPKTGTNTFNVAWIDLPTEAAPTQIQTHSVGLQFADSYNASYPADGDNFFLVKNDPAAFFPSARLEPPLNDNDNVALSPCNGLPSGASIVGASGKRLIQFHLDTTTGAFQPVFGFQNDAGAATSQYGGDVNLFADTGEVSPAYRFQSTYNGGLLWETNDILTLDGGAKVSKSVLLKWPLLNGSDTTFNGKRSVAIEQYPTQFSFGSQYAGPMAQIDSTTVLVTAAYASDPIGQTSVRAVKRSGDKLTVSPAPPSPGTSIAAPHNTLGVVAGRTFGYVLVPPSGSVAPDTKVYVFDPNCK